MSRSIARLVGEALGFAEKFGRRGLLGGRANVTASWNRQTYGEITTTAALEHGEGSHSDTTERCVLSPFTSSLLSPAFSIVYAVVLSLHLDFSPFALYHFVCRGSSQTDSSFVHGFSIPPVCNFVFISVFVFLCCSIQIPIASAFG